MDTNSFIVHLKHMIFTKILQNTLKQDLRLFKKVRPLPKGKNKKIIGLIKDELDEEVM